MTEEITKKVQQDLREEIRAEVRAEFQMLYQQQFQSMRPVPSPIEEHVIPPPPTGRSGKGSCSASAIPEDDMDDGSPCLLYILEDTEMVLVARGTEFRSATVCHGMQLLEDEVKVSVEEMIIPDASVPLSTEEIFTVEQAYKSFITWPKFLVKPFSDPSTQAQEKIPLSEDDPLSSLHLLADILDDKPLEVEYDANVFGTGSEVPIYLNSQDVRELASGTQELNISIIQLWTMYMSGVSNKLGRSDDYGFIDPQSIHESNDFEQINMSLIRSFGRGKKIYFLPYISGRHWQLLVMSMQDNYALWFCSLHRPPPTQLKQAIDYSIPASMMMGGRSIVNSRKIAWISLKCNRQNGSYECGYYVMYWMTHIVRSHITSRWETRFKTTTLVPEKSLLFIRNAAAKYIIRLYNSS
ncbi:uncharacterized protein LOC128197682 [Vigna angularis]|uniref:uncharacterized protein LOC128197682 n=1 Tax=Phaseolus angularis TaxID=3914 RepID=UPI0022B31D7B|nr:uncharacterized protein LOC128197682 [Vigna angularis]